MKKTATIVGSFLMAACLSLGVNAFAGNASITHLDNYLPDIQKNIPKFNKFPDLTVTNIEAVQNGVGKCYLRVSVRNNGPGTIPDEIYTTHQRKVSIQMYVNNKPWGGMALYGFDWGKHLQHPGKTVTRDWFKTDNNLLHAGLIYNIKVVADSNRELIEANESNNVLIKSVECGPRIK